MINAPPEQQLLPRETLPAMQAGEPLLTLTINGRVLRFPVRWAGLLAWQHIPIWLRDSTAEIKVPRTSGQDEALSKPALELMRSGIKNLMRPFLPLFLRGLFGRDESRWPPGVHLPKGREDTLPIIVSMVLNVLLVQAFEHPLTIEYDDATGFITDLRPGQRVAPASDARNAPGSAGEGRA